MCVQASFHFLIAAETHIIIIILLLLLLES